MNSRALSRRTHLDLLLCEFLLEQLQAWSPGAYRERPTFDVVMDQVPRARFPGREWRLWTWTQLLLPCTSSLYIIPAHLLTCDPSVSQRQSVLERVYFHMMQHELHADCYQVYHASPTSTVACDGTRRTFVQQVTFDSSGNPVLGTPVAPGKAINEPV